MPYRLSLLTGLLLLPMLALAQPANLVYWVNGVENKIQRGPIDGPHAEDLVTMGLSSPEGIALDVAGGKMYWTDVGTDKIQRADLDGSGVEDLYTAADGLDFPYGIALDAQPPPSDLRVHFKRPAGRGLPHVQITSTTPNVGTTTAPGEPMVAEGCGWYSYRFRGAQSAIFSFNGYPADPLPETVPLTRDRKAFFVPDAPGGGALTGTWHLRNPDAACVVVEPGKWALWGGDGTADDDVSAFDFLNAWLPINGGPAGYNLGDFNMDGTGTSFDFLTVWLPANGQSSQVVD